MSERAVVRDHLVALRVDVFQLTESPWLIMIASGANAVLLMLTWTVAAFAGAASPSAATAVTSSLRMLPSPFGTGSARWDGGARASSVKRP